MIKDVKAASKRIIAKKQQNRQLRQQLQAEMRQTQQLKQMPRGQSSTTLLQVGSQSNMDGDVASKDRNFSFSPLVEDTTTGKPSPQKAASTNAGGQQKPLEEDRVHMLYMGTLRDDADKERMLTMY